MLQGLHAPTSHGNLLSLGYWAMSEGMPAAAYNWLATSTSWPGDTRHPPYSEPFRRDFATGVAATVDFLRGSYYNAVRAALQGDHGPRAIWTAVNRSPWCSGCQSGHYPVDLYDYLQGHGVTLSPQPGPGHGGGGGGHPGRGGRGSGGAPLPHPPAPPRVAHGEAGWRFFTHAIGVELPTVAGRVHAIAQAIRAR